LKLTVKTLNGTLEVPFTSEKTILEALESHNIEVHPHCRDGFCGACRCKISDASKVAYIVDPLAYINDEEFLPCCSIPLSDIDIDVTT
tara:strand:+ start:1434 stop:1697 length:264 start_codon:yes stop_codon:yes gene_type:complete